MKKLIPVFIVCTLLLGACKQTMLDSYRQTAGGKGSVTIRIGGGTRAVGYQADGFPDLSKTDIEIKAAYTGGSVFAHKTVTPQDGSHELTVQADIGKEIIVSVIVTAGSAVWQGDAVHTVTAGANTVAIKIKKMPRSVGMLLFSLDTSNQSPQLSFELTPNTRRNTLELLSGHTDIAFCRGKNGSLYLAYTPPAPADTVRFERYNSDGTRAASFDVHAYSSHPFRYFLAADYTTGMVYAVKDDGSGLSLVTFNGESGSLTTVTGHLSMDGIQAFAADGGQIFYAGTNGVAPTGNSIKLHTAVVTQDPNSTRYVVTEDSQNYHLANERYTDLTVKNGAVYLLAADSHGTHGKLIRYTYNKEAHTLTEGHEYGYAGTDASGTILPIDESKHFRNPIRFIGFDTNHIYIADDGLYEHSLPGKGRVTVNSDRIAAFDTVQRSLSFQEALPDCRWMQHKNPKNAHFTFFDFDTGNKVIKNLFTAENVHGTVKKISIPDQTAALTLPVNPQQRGHLVTGNRNDTVYVSTAGGLEKWVCNGNQYRKDTAFKGTADSLTAMQAVKIVNPVYDPVSGALYGQTENPSKLYRYDELANTWRQVALTSGTEALGASVYAVYGDTFYGWAPEHGTHLVHYTGAENPGGTYRITSKNALEPLISERAAVTDLYAAEGFLYALLISADKTKAWAARLSIDSHVPRVVQAITNPASVSAWSYLSFMGYRRNFDTETGTVYIAAEGITAGYDAWSGIQYTTGNYDGIMQWTGEENDRIAAVTSTPLSIWLGTAAVQTGAPPVNTPIVVWKPSSPSGQDKAYDYYQLTSAADPLPSVPLLQSTPTRKYSDVFCFDQRGTCYVVYDNTKIAVLTLKNGRYELGTTPEEVIGIDGIGTAHIEALAVDYSRNTRYLYYAYKDTAKQRFIIGQHTLTSMEQKNKTDFLQLPSSHTSKEGNTIIQAEYTVTALAANKDGIFAAVKETTEKTIPETSKQVLYRIAVKKYNHGGGIVSEIEVVPQTDAKHYVPNAATPAPNTAIVETLNDIYVRGNRVYGIRSIVEGNAIGSAKPDRICMWGQLFTIGTSAADMTGGIHSLLNTQTQAGGTVYPNLTGRLVPYRFIAAHNKKLVIASDGAWGEGPGSGNLNKIWDFSISSDGELGPVGSQDTNAEFSKKIVTAAGGSAAFEWQ